MIDSNYIKIFTGNFIIVQRIVNALENINIIAIVKDESESGRLAGFGAAIQNQQEVYINKEELDKAVPIVERISKELQA